jgi:hypothetical protein
MSLGITLTLAPRLHRAWSKICVPIEQVMVGDPRSFFFSRRQLSVAVLHSFVNFTTFMDGKGHLLLMISLMYLANEGTYKTYINGTLMCTFSTISMKHANCSLIACFLVLVGNGRYIVSMYSSDTVFSSDYFCVFIDVEGSSS